jgi:lipoprotein-anchoring transpeptidase ErfK/SrfK
MKCPNHLCQHGIEGSPADCPRCGIPLPGAVLADRFSLERVGRVTPFSVTFVAFDRERTTETQVRIYIPRFGRSAAGLKSEIKALKEMQFEQLPRIYNFGWDADFPWVAEDKIAGNTMVGRLVGRDRPFAEPELIGTMLEAARILEKLHTLHIYHRDIRPETLYNRDSDNRLMLGSPGWEREFQDKGNTKNRNVYTAPETTNGRATALADLYSLGVTAIHLITGLHPEGLFQASTRTFQWQRAVKVSPRLAEVIDGLVADAPGDRIQSAGRLVQLLSTLDREGTSSPEAKAVPGAASGTKGQQENAPEDPKRSGTAPGLAAAAAGTAGALAASAPASPSDTGGTAAAEKTQNWGGLRKQNTHEAKRERKLKALVAAMGAALAALFGVVAALLQRIKDNGVGHTLQLHGAKILVALGVATGAATVGKAVGDAGEPRRPEQIASAADTAPRAYGRDYALPDPVIGQNAEAVPSTAAGTMAAAHALPDPSLLGRWVARRDHLKSQIASLTKEHDRLTRQLQADRAARYGGPGLESLRPGRVGPDGFAFSDGSRPEIQRIVSLYSSIFPWHGGKLAVGAQASTAQQLSEVEAAKLLAATVGLPPTLMALANRQRAQQGAGAPGTDAGKLVAEGLASASQAVAALVPPAPISPQLARNDAQRHDWPNSIDADPADREAKRRSPYDKNAEPGTAAADASGLNQPPSPFFIRVNKTYRTLTLYRNGQYEAQFNITVGKGANTPDGRFNVQNKVENPPYETIPGGHRQNPLGSRWLGLDVNFPGGRSIGLHGTNRPEQLGDAQSAGCIRLSNDDVEKLYKLVPTGTPVEII